MKYIENIYMYIYRKMCSYKARKIIKIHVGNYLRAVFKICMTVLLNYYNPYA